MQVKNINMVITLLTKKISFFFYITKVSNSGIIFWTPFLNILLVYRRPSIVVSQTIQCSLKFRALDGENESVLQ